MLEDPRALPLFFITFYSMILINARLFKINISYRKIAIFSVILSLFDYTVKYITFKLGYLLIWHILLSLALMVILLYKFNRTNFFSALTLSVTSYILLFLSETLTTYPILILLKNITGVKEKVILSNQVVYNVSSLFMHLPLFIWALVYILKNKSQKGKFDP